MEWRDLVTRQKREKSIVTTAYTSLGGSRFRASGSNWGSTVSTIAAKFPGATEAQVLLRWALQQGVAVIPGSASEAHIRENLFLGAGGRFELGTDDFEAIGKAKSPQSWFDPSRGPAKMKGREAEVAWGGSGGK